MKNIHTITVLLPGIHFKLRSYSMLFVNDLKEPPRITNINCRIVIQIISKQQFPIQSNML